MISNNLQKEEYIIKYIKKYFKIKIMHFNNIYRNKLTRDLLGGC